MHHYEPHWNSPLQMFSIRTSLKCCHCLKCCHYAKELWTKKSDVPVDPH